MQGGDTSQWDTDAVSMDISPPQLGAAPVIPCLPGLEALLGLEPFPSMMLQALVAITTGFRLQK